MIVEIGQNAKDALETAVQFQFPQRMKCRGDLLTPEANEAVLHRYEDEGRPPALMVPFLAVADLDGDRRADLYLRLEGMPEVVIFNAARGLKAVPVENAPIESFPRCDASPVRYARPVPRRLVKCADETQHSAEAIERVEHNHGSNLLMWKGDGFATCEPAGSQLPPPTKKKADGSW